MVYILKKYYVKIKYIQTNKKYVCMWQRNLFLLFCGENFRIFINI